jgi:hypothetical protein
MFIKRLALILFPFDLNLLWHRWTFKLTINIYSLFNLEILIILLMRIEITNNAGFRDVLVIHDR